MKDKKKLSFFDVIVLGVNVLLAIAILISYLAPVTDPQKFWLVAFFGLAYPILLMANLIMLLYWLLRKKWLLLLSFFCILLGYKVLFNNVGFQSNKTGSINNLDQKQKTPATLRVMTYNVHNFKRYGSRNDVSTKHDILQIINDQQPDVIGLQEFYTRNNGEYDMRDSIVTIMKPGFFYFEPVVFNYQEAIGIAIFSRFPIVNRGIVPITAHRSENACIYVDIKKYGKIIRVYNIHLQSIRFDPEDYKYVNSIVQDGKTDLSSTRRLGGKLKIAFIKRSAQVAKIKADAATCPYPYIIAGDFNDTPASYAVNEMAKGLKNAFREKGAGVARTYNGDFPNFQIDYIMASPQFDVANYTIIQKKLSDHYPVRSDLVIGH
jgi:endonuclease/exonuclease/phosphatase family metal-dependent hydrolase